MNPGEQGAGSFEGGYNSDQQAIIGIQPDAGGDYVEELSLQNYDDHQGNVANGIEIIEGLPLQNQPFTLKFGFLYNSGNTNFTGDALVALTDKDGQIVKELLGYRFSQEPLQPYYGFIDVKDVTITSSIQPGYRIRLFYRTAKKPEWTLVRANDEEGCVWDLVISDLISIEKTTTLTYDKTSRTLRLQVLEGVTATLQAADGTDFSAFCKKNGTEISIDASGFTGGRYTLTLKMGEDTKTVTFVLPEVK